jgi:hypothetical protein
MPLQCLGFGPFGPLGNERCVWSTCTYICSLHTYIACTSWLRSSIDDPDAFQSPESCLYISGKSMAVAENKDSFQKVGMYVTYYGLAPGKKER